MIINYWISNFWWNILFYCCDLHSWLEFLKWQDNRVSAGLAGHKLKWVLAGNALLRLKWRENISLREKITLLAFFSRAINLLQILEILAFIWWTFEWNRRDVVAVKVWAFVAFVAGDLLESYFACSAGSKGSNLVGIIVEYIELQALLGWASDDLEGSFALKLEAFYELALVKRLVWHDFLAAFAP